MGIKNGDLPDADEVMNAFGTTFNDRAQLIFNADYIGWNSTLDASGIPPFIDFNYNTFKNTNSTGIDTTNTTAIFDGIITSTDKKINFAELFDDFEDDSINVNIWSTAVTNSATVTESSGSLTANCTGAVPKTAKATADQVNAIDYKSTSIDKEVFIFHSWTASVPAFGGATAKTVLRFTDGSNIAIIHNVELDGTGGGQNNNGSQRLRIVINHSAEEFKISVNGGALSGAVSLSALSNWYIEINTETAVNAACIATRSLNRIHHINGDQATSDFVSNHENSDSLITNAILTVNDNIGISGASHDYFLSANSGLNYENVTINQIHRFANVGSQIKFKLVATTGSVDVSTAYNNTNLHEYAIKYNFY